MNSYTRWLRVSFFGIFIALNQCFALFLVCGHA